MNSLAPFHWQVAKALRNISQFLVSLLALLLYRDNFPSISNRGKWAYPSQIMELPPYQKCIVAVARERLFICVSPDLHLVEWTRHNMDSSQIVAAYIARQSGSQVELSRITVSLEFECFLENGYDKGNKILTITFIGTSLDFWALSHFAFFWWNISKWRGNFFFGVLIQKILWVVSWSSIPGSRVLVRIEYR